MVGALKAKNEGSLSAATAFTCPPDPRYGTKPMEMAQAKAAEALRLVQSANPKKLQKAGEKSFKAQEKERIRMARMGIVRALLPYQALAQPPSCTLIHAAAAAPAQSSGGRGRVRRGSGDPDGAVQVWPRERPRPRHSGQLGQRGRGVGPRPGAGAGARGVGGGHGRHGAADPGAARGHVLGWE
eukprot:COSAG01_NODE_2306_length_7946_cov_4.903148_7_plen_184_part_00